MRLDKLASPVLRLARDERGAVLIHVAFALIALLAFLGVVIDQGAFFVARGQVQAAADAGVMAAAKELMKDPTATVNAATVARQFVNYHSVWGQTIGNANIDINFPQRCPDGTMTCIRVDAMRGLPGKYSGGHSNSMPTFVLGIIGLSTQGTRATAMAQIANGKSVNCMKPWVVPDKWHDVSATGLVTSGADQWDQEDVFNSGSDTYTPGVDGFHSTGTPNEYGMRMALKDGDMFDAGWALEIDLGAPNSGSPSYIAEIIGCPDWVPEVGIHDSTAPNCTGANPPDGCLSVLTGMRTGPTRTGVETLIGYDPLAHWNDTTKQVEGGCTDTSSCQAGNPAGLNISPRIVPLAVFNPQAYATQGGNGTNGYVQVSNILGYFVEGFCDDLYGTPPNWCGKHADRTVIGRLVNYVKPKGKKAADTSSFMKYTPLVQ